LKLRPGGSIMPFANADGNVDAPGVVFVFERGKAEMVSTIIAPGDWFD